MSNRPVNSVKSAIVMNIVLTNWLTSDFESITLISNAAIEKRSK